MTVIIECNFKDYQPEMSMYLSTNVATVPTFLYSVQIPVKIHGSLYQFWQQRKTQNMLIKKTLFLLIKINAILYT